MTYNVFSGTFKPYSINQPEQAEERKWGEPANWGVSGK